MGKYNKKLAGMLLKRGLIDEEQRDELLNECDVISASLSDVVISKGLIDEPGLLGLLSNPRAIANRWRIPVE